jgi:murein DD-endopeptidase MepM/ murein hydrolase activator NlpD
MLKPFSKRYIKSGNSVGVYNIELTDLERQYVSEEISLGATRIGGATALRTLYLPFYEKNIRVSQKFIPRSHPAYDFAIMNGTKLHCMFPAKGQVTFMGNSSGYAYNIRVIYPEYSYMSLYGHLQATDTWADNLKVGDWVEPAQFLCRSDNTGNSTGPHLHLEIRVPPYAGYSNCIDYWSMLMDLPTTVPPTEPPTDPFELPEFPKLPEWQLTTTQPLSIRQLPGTGSKIMGYLEPDKIMPVMEAQMLGKDLWLKIGHGEWIAAVYHIGTVENVWGKWVE